MRLSFQIALRFLSHNKGQTFLIILGIAIGVSVQVFIGSLISGLQKSLVDSTIGSSSQITIKSEEKTGRIPDYAEIINSLNLNEANIKEITPVADAAGFLKKDSNTWPVLARGFEFSSAEGIYKLKKALVSGAFPGENEILVGKDLADEANLNTGDTIELLTPIGSKSMYKISGIYDLPVSGINKSWVIGTLKLVQNLFEYGDEVTSIEMQTNEIFKADVLGEAIKENLSSKYKVENWKELNASLLSGLSGQSISSLMIQIFVLISVILGIASVLAISVLQKSKQLGILKAMGIKNRTASLIFLFQGAVLGIFGALLGVGFGLGLSLAFSKFALKPDGTPVVALFIDPLFITVSAAIALFSATIAALVPARRSSKLDPIEVIKNG